MSQTVNIEVNHWFRIHNCDAGDFELKIGDQVVIKTDTGSELGRVTGIIQDSDKKENNQSQQAQNQILRKVTTEDLNMLRDQSKQKSDAIKYFRQCVDRHKLPIKAIDVHFSFDGGRLVFPFIADGRVDFRELVKDLSHHFQKSIRLQQIGIRDEAKITGDFGSCGRGLCCKSHLDLKELGSITSDLADLQQVSHRGSDRLTGSCGRLRCCLAFEKEVYLEAAKNLPALGSMVKTKQGQGRVVGLNILKQTIDVAINDDRGNIVEISVDPKKPK